MEFTYGVGVVGRRGVIGGSWLSKGGASAGKPPSTDPGAEQDPGDVTPSKESREDAHHLTPRMRQKEMIPIAIVSNVRLRRANR